MVRIISFGLAGACAAMAAAMAQAPADAPAGAESEAAAPVSELDRLSQTTDDAFLADEQATKRRPISVTLRALDKITARYNDLETPIGTAVKFGSLEILPRFCDKRPPEEFPETTAFLEIFDRDLSRARAASAEKGEAPALREGAAEEPAPAGVAAAEADADAKPVDPDRIFSGWMFASSPALNPLEHAVYDVWVIDCKTAIVDN